MRFHQFHRRQLGRSSGPKVSELVDQSAASNVSHMRTGHKWHEYLSLEPEENRVDWWVNTATYSLRRVDLQSCVEGVPLSSVRKQSGGVEGFGLKQTRSLQPTMDLSKSPSD